MEAKDTVMHLDGLQKAILAHADLPMGEAIAVEQAEISFKAGIREVVEWIQKEGIWAQVPFKGKRKEETMWCLFPEEWQAQLKEWFKDSPELLEKWGIK